MRTLIPLAAALALVGCASSPDVVVLRHPETGQTAECVAPGRTVAQGIGDALLGASGNAKAASSYQGNRSWQAHEQQRGCISDFQAQGYVREAQP